MAAGDKRKSSRAGGAWSNTRTREAVTRSILGEVKKCDRTRPRAAWANSGITLLWPGVGAETSKCPFQPELFLIPFQALLPRIRTSLPGTRTHPKRKRAMEGEWIQHKMWRDPRCAAKARVPAAKWETANGRGASSDGAEVAQLRWSPETQLLMLSGHFPNVRRWASPLGWFLLFPESLSSYWRYFSL